MKCHLCGKDIVAVSSATLELAVWQHYLWIHNVGIKTAYEASR